MKKIILLVLASCQAFAQPIPVYPVGKVMDKNKVKARIYTPNYKFWNVYGNQAASYEVPVGSGINAMTANSLWIGGLDNNSKLHLSANTYRQFGNGSDWWPGPLDTVNTAAFTYSNTLAYNTLWKVDCNDINAFATAFDNGQVAAGTYTIPADLLNYPAKGVANFQKQQEAFYDANHDGNYDPQHDGDYPIIKGQQQILSVFNDSYAHHAESGGRSMGLEVHEYSYAYSEPSIADTMQAINYTTFYHYTIYNRSDTDYYHVYLTDWADIDLGYFDNDLIGTDTINEFAYCYNAGTTDPNGLNGLGYGTRLPVISLAMLKTDCGQDGIDNDNDGIIDNPGEQFHPDRTTFYNNNFGYLPGPVANPTAVVNPDGGNPQEYYNYMSGFWKDGTPFTYGGAAYGGTLATSFVYPGDPSINTGWTEGSANDSAGDRRILFSSHLFHFPKKSKIEWGFAVVFSQDTTQHTNTISQFHSRVQRDVRNVRFYESTHQAAECTPAIYSTVGIKENTPAPGAFMYPNPASKQLMVELSQNVPYARVVVNDVSGRQVQQKEITQARTIQLDLSALENGIYFVSLDAGTTHLVKKIVKN